MKKVELSEARAMLKEILAAKSASRESVSAVLWLGEVRLEGREFSDLDELTGPFWAIVDAAQTASNGTIMVEESVWKDLEQAYYNRVTKPLFL